MATFLLAQSTSDDAGGGALLSLWFPLGLFIIVAAILWVIYARPHRRVPPRPPAHAHGATSVAGTAGPVSGLASGPGAGPAASAGPTAGDSPAQQPGTPPPGTDDPGHRQ